MGPLFTWGGQSTGVSALASFLPKKSQGWSASEWTGWIFLQSRGLSRVFSNTTVQKHQFFGAQLSSQSNSHIHTWLLEKPLNHNNFHGSNHTGKQQYCLSLKQDIRHLFPFLSNRRNEKSIILSFQMVKIKGNPWMFVSNFNWRMMHFPVFLTNILNEA